MLLFEKVYTVLFQDYLYISDWESNKIHRVSWKNSSDHRPITDAYFHSPAGLKVFHKQTQPICKCSLIQIILIIFSSTCQRNYNNEFVLIFIIFSENNTLYFSSKPVFQ